MPPAVTIQMRRILSPDNGCIASRSASGYVQEDFLAGSSLDDGAGHLFKTPVDRKCYISQKHTWYSLSGPRPRYTLIAVTHTKPGCSRCSFQNSGSSFAHCISSAGTTSNWPKLWFFAIVLACSKSQLASIVAAGQLNSGSTCAVYTYFAPPGMASWLEMVTPYCGLAPSLKGSTEVLSSVYDSVLGLLNATHSSCGC